MVSKGGKPAFDSLPFLVVSKHVMQITSCNIFSIQVRVGDAACPQQSSAHMKITRTFLGEL